MYHIFCVKLTLIDFLGFLSAPPPAPPMASGGSFGGGGFFLGQNSMLCGGLGLGGPGGGPPPPPVDAFFSPLSAPAPSMGAGFPPPPPSSFGFSFNSAPAPPPPPPSGGFLFNAASAPPPPPSTNSLIDLSFDDVAPVSYSSLGFTSRSANLFGSAPPMKSAARNSSSSSRSQPGPSSGLSQLISLQAAEGFWILNDSLASLTGVSLSVLKSACPDGVSVNVWATVLALVLLEKRFNSQHDEWELVAMKAEMWIQAQPLASNIESLKAIASQTVQF